MHKKDAIYKKYLSHIYPNFNLSENISLIFLLIC